MATLGQIIEMGIDTAIAGTDPNASAIQLLRKEAETLLDQALHDLEADIALNPQLRPRGIKEFTVSLVNGIGAVPATVLVEHVIQGVVKDADGNILSHVTNRADFDRYLTTVYGHYCIDGDTSGISQILTRAIFTGDPAGTNGPLALMVPHTPTKANLNTEVADEIVDDLAVKLAVKLRGLIAEMPAAA